ncbi:hypothetical protein J6590_027434 [Homalodisca vitripennis]|nr:hypothetical protein J6590_027434 [Homalodisca vitripennis]
MCQQEDERKKRCSFRPFVYGLESGDTIFAIYKRKLMKKQCSYRNRPKKRNKGAKVVVLTSHERNGEGQRSGQGARSDSGGVPVHSSFPPRAFLQSFYSKADKTIPCVIKIDATNLTGLACGREAGDINGQKRYKSPIRLLPLGIFVDKASTNRVWNGARFVAEDGEWTLRGLYGNHFPLNPTPLLYFIATAMQTRKCSLGMFPSR